MAPISEEPGPAAEPLQADTDAFETLVRQYQSMVHALCYRMTGSAEDAEDLAQETFTAAYRHLAGFRNEARISSWLYRIAIRRCLNWRKKRQRNQELDQHWAQELGEQPGQDPRVPYVQAALLKLNEKQRAAIVLTVYENLTHAEAAAALGCSETTVSWRIFAARRKLKRWLQNSLCKEPGL